MKYAPMTIKKYLDGIRSKLAEILAPVYGTDLTGHALAELLKMYDEMME